MKVSINKCQFVLIKNDWTDYGFQNAALRAFIQQHFDKKYFKSVS